MDEVRNILISLEQVHAENILSGKKHIELRRRSMSVEPGTVVWIYVKKPLGAVVGYARVVDSHTLSPLMLWEKFSRVSGLSRQDFFAYFDGVSKGFALSLAAAERLHKPVSLESLRRSGNRFHPPQFFMRLPSEDCVLKLLHSTVQSKPDNEHKVTGNHEPHTANTLQQSAKATG
ncbi:MAG: transcriptional regulator [Betaproteobacteria bacterium]|nr:transcriptional regulator [Betaproteobacteria bacterium]